MSTRYKATLLKCIAEIAWSATKVCFVLVLHIVLYYLRRLDLNVITDLSDYYYYYYYYYYYCCYYYYY